MTREDYIWVAMRVLGIYMVVLAVTNLPGFITGLYFVSTLWKYGPPLPVDAGAQSAVHMKHLVFKTYSNQAVTRILKVLIFSASGWYLLCRGGFLFSLVSAQNPLSGGTADADEEPAKEADEGSVSSNEVEE